MRIVCIGGGPAGLYFGLLMKKENPAHHVTVVERNQPYDTFGWGVVFSDATMDNMRAWDAETANEIESAFNHWDDIEVLIKGRRMRTTGHGFVGIGRKKLLNILQSRCEELGVELVFEREVDSDLEFPDADLIIASRRHQFEDPQPLQGVVQARHGRAAEPLHLARHQQAVRRLHLRFPPHRARLVPGAHLQIRRRHIDLHRRDDRRHVQGARPRQGRRSALDRLLRRTVLPKCSTAPS